MPSIRLLKGQAVAAYIDYHEEADRYDCGLALGEVINPRLSDAKKRFNTAMEQLRELDPNCPSYTPL